MIRLGAALLCLLTGTSCVSESLGAPPECTSDADCDLVRCVDGSCQTAGCGNHELEEGEECDDGALDGTPGNACTVACVLRGCGDGTLDADLGEVCDGEGCKSGCVGPVACGDGELDASELCDDGDEEPGDGCEVGCRCSGPAAIATIWQSVVALRGDGTVFAWGFLPDVTAGTGTERPVRLALPAAVEVAAGAALAAIRTGDGQVLVLDGEEVAGGFDGIPATGNPVELPGRYVRVSAGFDHLLLLDADGGVHAIGSNEGGQAGVGRVGSPGDRLAAPEQVALPLRAVEIAAGRFDSLAILEDGTVWAWGMSYLGETGILSPQVELPRQVSTLLSGCDRLRTSGPTSFARCDGGWWGWGFDHYGQLEGATGIAPLASCLDGSRCNPVPAVLRELPFPLADLAVGQAAVYALDDAGAVWGWGSASPPDTAWDALGRHGADELVTPTPLQLPLPGRYLQLAAGFNTGFALHESGALYSAGLSEGGALGREMQYGSGLGWDEATSLCGPPR